MNAGMTFEMAMNAQQLKRLFSWYGPFLGAGVKIERIDDNWRYCKVAMRLRWYNRNAVDVHFGGSLYSMVDPHYMLLLMKCLGPEYTVWDKAASIEFVRPGKGYVYAEFKITDEILDDIKQHTANGEKYLPTLPVEIKGEDGKVVCRVEKTLYIRRGKQSGVRI